VVGVLGFFFVGGWFFFVVFFFFFVVLFFFLGFFFFVLLWLVGGFLGGLKHVLRKTELLRSTDRCCPSFLLPVVRRLLGRKLDLLVRRVVVYFHSFIQGISVKVDLLCYLGVAI